MVPFGFQAVFREPSMFVLVGVKVHQGIEVCALEGILGLFKTLLNISRGHFVCVNRL
jgi:hypothetical protein